MIVVQHYSGGRTRSYSIRAEMSDLTDIKQIPGVIECRRINRHAAAVEIALSFEWKEVESSLLPKLHEVNKAAGCEDEVVKYVSPQGNEANPDGSLRFPDIPAAAAEPEVAEENNRKRIGISIVADMVATANRIPLVPSAEVFEWADLLRALYTFDETMLNYNLDKFKKYLDKADSSEPGAQEQQLPA